MSSSIDPKNKKDRLARYLQLVLVVVAAGSIFPLIYLRHGYEVTILEVFNLEVSQLNTIFSTMGIVTLLGYFPSGYLSDKFSAKWLLAFSLFMTGVTGLWFAQVPPYSSIIIIYIIWGFFSIFTFWGAHLKLVKLLASKGEEGKFFGIWDGGRGVVEALLAMAALFIFGNIIGNIESQNPQRALVAVIYMYSFFLITVSVLVAIFVKDVKEAKMPKEDRFGLKGLKELLQNRLIFLMGGIIFMSYSVFWTFRTMSGFIQNSIGATAVTAAGVMVIAQWLRPVGGMLGGALADKFGKANVLVWVLSLGSAMLVVLAFLPQNMPANFAIATILACITFLWAIRGTYWSILADCKVSDNVMGLAIGLISLIGYLPDIFAPMVNTLALNLFNEGFGINGYYIISAGFGVIGVVLIIIFKRLSKQEKQIAMNILPKATEQV